MTAQDAQTSGVGIALVAAVIQTLSGARGVLPAWSGKPWVYRGRMSITSTDCP